VNSTACLLVCIILHGEYAKFKCETCCQDEGKSCGKNSMNFTGSSAYGVDSFDSRLIQISDPDYDSVHYQKLITHRQFILSNTIQSVNVFVALI